MKFKVGDKFMVRRPKERALAVSRWPATVKPNGIPAMPEDVCFAGVAREAPRTDGLLVGLDYADGGWDFYPVEDLIPWNAEPAKSVSSCCTCKSLLYGCQCGGGAKEIAASTGREKDPWTGCWV